MNIIGFGIPTLMCKFLAFLAVFTICSDFIENWVKICTPAKSKVKSQHSSLSFEEQCHNCEKVSLNRLHQPPDLIKPVLIDYVFYKDAT